MEPTRSCGLGEQSMMMANASPLRCPLRRTGDSLARCGRTRLPGYYDFNSLTYGVAQSLALAEYLSHIITEGEQPYDMATEFDPLRYGGWATPEHLINR